MSLSNKKIFQYRRVFSVYYVEHDHELGGGLSAHVPSSLEDTSKIAKRNGEKTYLVGFPRGNPT